MPLADEQIQSLLGPPPDPATQPPRVSDPRITALGPQPRTGQRPAPLTWKQRNERTGIDLFENPEELLQLKDDEAALAYADRMAGAKLRTHPEDQVKYLEGIYGAGNVRLSDDQRPIITVYDTAKQKPVEFSFLGEKATPSDVYSGLVASGPEVAGALGGALLSRKLPLPKESRFLKWSAEMMGAAAGQEAGGAAKDIATSALPLDVILKERFWNIPVSATVNAALGAAGVAAAKVITPMGGAARTKVEQDLDDAVEFFRKEFGIEYPRTMGEKTGSSILKRSEATLARYPGSSAAFDKIKADKLQAFRDIQNKALSSGKGVTPEEVGMLERLAEDVGEDAIRAISAKIDPIKYAAELAQNQTAKAVHSAAMNELEGAAGAIGKFYPEKAGQAIRAGVFEAKLKDKAVVDALYDDLRKAGSTVKNLNLSSLADDARQLLKEQASIRRTATPSPVLGPSGQPILQTTQGDTLAREFVPQKVLSSLEEIATWDSATTSLDDLLKVRSSIGDLIEGGQALPGIETRFLNQLKSKITKTIDAELSKLPTSELKDKLSAANEAYSKYAQKYENREISRLFKEVDSGGFVQDEDIIRNIGPTEYQTYKKFFGENSAEIASVKRSVLEGIVNDSVPLGSDMINGSEFLKKLSSFVKDKRSIADDILGEERVKKLVGIGKVSQLLSEEVPLDKAKVTSLLANPPKDLAKQLDALVAEQKELSKLYRSKILEDISTGKLGKDFNAGEFMDRAYKSSSPAEIGEIVRLLEDNPKELDNLRRKVMERVFYEAQSGKGEAVRVGKGDPFGTSSAQAISDIIGSEDNKEKMTRLLGADRMAVIQNIAKLVRGGEVAEQTFRGAATFAASAQTGKAIHGGLLSYAGTFVAQKFAAFLYTRPISWWAQNQALAGDRPEQLVRSIIASKPFAEAMINDLGDKGYDMLREDLYNSIDRYNAEGPAGTAAVRKQDWVDQILNQPQKTNRQVVFPAP